MLKPKQTHLQRAPMSMLWIGVSPGPVKQFYDCWTGWGVTTNGLSIMLRLHGTDRAAKRKKG